MSGHLSSMLVVAIACWEDFFIRKIFIMFNNLLMLLIRHWSLMRASVPWNWLVRHRPWTTRQPCSNAAKDSRWNRCWYTVTRLTVTGLCTNLKDNNKRLVSYHELLKYFIIFIKDYYCFLISMMYGRLLYRRSVSE